MSSQRYERVRSLQPGALYSQPTLSTLHQTLIHMLSQISESDHADVSVTPTSPENRHSSLSSPPPSFRSRTSSPSSRRFLSREDPTTTDAERTLADTFDDGSDSDDGGNDGGDDRRRLIRSNTVQSIPESRVVHDGDRPGIQRAITQFPPTETPAALDVPARPYTGSSPYSSFSHSNDGVFANLNAKPERGEKLEEQPPVSHSNMYSVCKC